MNLVDVTSVARLAAGLLIAFVVVPRLVLPRPAAARSGLDAGVINALRWMFVVVVASHVLTLLGLYSFVSMTAVALAVGWTCTWRHRVGGVRGLLTRTFAADEETAGQARRPGRATGRELLVGAGLIAPVVGVLLLSYWIRLQDSLATMSLTVPDAYIHMGWAAQLRDGLLWEGGYYPTGFATILSYLQLFTPGLDMYGVARYGAALVGTTVVFGLYFCIVRLTANPAAALLGAGSLGLFAGNEDWREPWHRVVSLLPQEFAFGIGLLLVPFAVLAMTESRSGRDAALARRSHMVTLGLGTFAVCQLHPLSGAAAAALVCATGAVAALLTRRWRSALLTLGAVVLAVGLNGIAPLLMELLGYPQYSGGLGGISAQSGDTDLRRVAAIAKPYSPLAYLAMACAASAVVAGVLMLRRDRLRSRGVHVVSLAVVSLGATLLYDLEPLADAANLSYFLLTRVSQLVALTMPVAIGLGLAALTLLADRLKPLPAFAGMVAAGTLVLAGFGAAFGSAGVSDQDNKINYDATVAQARHISTSFSPNAVTIVSTSDVRLTTLGRTRFAELWVFARDLDEVGFDEDLPIPTPQVFIVVEKRPFPVTKLNPHQASEEYYQDPVKRGRVMSRVYVWAQRYLHEGRGPGEMSIYHEDDQVAIFRYRRNPALVPDNTDKLFTDYTWERGELFNEGPVDPLEAWNDVARQLRLSPTSSQDDVVRAASAAAP